VKSLSGLRFGLTTTTTETKIEGSLFSFVWIDFHQVVQNVTQHLLNSQTRFLVLGSALFVFPSFLTWPAKNCFLFAANPGPFQ